MSPPKQAPRKGARQRTPSVEVEDAVISAAVTIIGRDGADGITVRRLASEAAVAPMTIYNRFGDMHGVFDAVFEHGFLVFADALHATPQSADPVTDLHRMGVVYRSFALANPDLYRFMFLNIVEDLEPSDGSSLAAARAFDALFTLVARALDLGRFRTANPSVISQQIWATCHGAVALELLGIAEFADPAETYSSLLITLLRGLLVDPTESEGLVWNPAPVR